METPSAEHRQRAQFIADHPDFQTHVSTLLSERLKAMGEQDVVSVEGKIYQGFYSANDKHLLAQFQNASWGERHQMLSQFHDQRLQELGLRLIATNAPELLSVAQRQVFAQAWSNKWKSEDSRDKPWMTTARFHRELAEIQKEGLYDENRINALKAFLDKLVKAPL